MEAKKCSKCGHIKELTEFGRHISHSDGCCSSCIVCERKGYFENLTIRKLSQRKYRKTNKGKAIMIAKANRYRKKYPQKERAKCLIAYAIKCCDIERQPCEVCKSTYKIEAHHPDYSKPLNVVWLCMKHHREWHKKYKAICSEQEPPELTNTII